MEKYILALDCGTTSCRSLLFDRQGEVRAVAQRELTQYFPKPGWVEHDPKEIWSTQMGTITEVLAKAEVEPQALCAVGITNQRETTIVWEKETGEPVYPAIVWQCRRTAEMTEKLEKDGYGPMVREKTGLVLDPYFSGTKIRWILDHIPDGQRRAEEGELLFGTVETWMIWKLTKGRIHVTDVSNASRTMLLNINALSWDSALLSMLQIPEAMLPDVRPSSEVYGMAQIGDAAVPIAGAAGDQQCALFGQGCYGPGEAKNTYGTGAFLLMNTGEKAVFSAQGLLTTVAWKIGDQPVKYALEGSIFVAGSAIQWLRDALRIVDSALDSEYYATRVADTDGVYMVPAFTGLGAPYWDPDARGMLIGLTRGTNRYHIVRATLESVAYLSNDVLQAMARDLGAPLTRLQVDGGASANNFLMQFQADMIQADVLRPSNLESTARGAAFLAGLAVGFWSSTAELQELTKMERVFHPKMDAAERELRQKRWSAAVERSLGWESVMRE